MKSYKFSIIYAIFLAVIHFFHFRLEKWMIRVSSRNFVIYSMMGLFLAFFLVILIKKRFKLDNLEIAVLLLTMGLVFFVFFSQPVVLFRLGVLEMFILGILLVMEGRKSRGFLPFLILAAAAVVVEISSNVSAGSTFYYLDAWRNTLVALCGYLAGSAAQTP